MMTFKTSASTVCALAAALALGACQRNDDDRTAGQKMDTAVASAEQKAGEIKQDMKQETAEAKGDINRAVDQAGDKMKDASITTAVNAELARDSELSALRINVDTAQGRVVLHGTAPSEAARQRATTLASRVDGVVSVDNQLSVGSRG
ncbi:BON domain-containing protein [Sphaerotilaceae bacterium SBD11-9]